MLNTMKILMKKDPKFRIGDNVRISKHENIFHKGYIRNCSEEVSKFPKLKIQFRGLTLLAI